MPALPFDKLNESNYNDWKIQIEALLEEKGLFGVVSGRDVMPPTGPNSKGVKTFLEKQRLARAKIILALEPSQLPHVRNEENPAVIWQNLARIHRARGLGVLLTMRMDFLKMSMSPDSTVASWVANIRHAAYCLEECYLAEERDSLTTSPPLPSTAKPPIVSELDKIGVLLNGLPPVYQPVIVSITGTPIASLTFEDVVTRLLNEEGRLRNIMSPRSPLTAEIDEAAAVTPVTRWKAKSPRSTSKNMITCFKCGGVGHRANVCPTNDSDAVANVVTQVESVDEDIAFTAIDDESGGDW